MAALRRENTTVDYDTQQTTQTPTQLKYLHVLVRAHTEHVQRVSVGFGNCLYHTELLQDGDENMTDEYGVLTS